MIVICLLKFICFRWFHSMLKSIFQNSENIVYINSYSYMFPNIKHKPMNFFLLTFINFDRIRKWFHPLKMWDNITYPFPNCDGRAVEILEWISNCIPHFTWCVITFYAGIKVIVKGALSHLNQVWNGWTDMTVVDYARVVSHWLCVHHSNRNSFSY